MYVKTRRIVSTIAALALLVTCAISGLILPVSAEDTVENLIVNGDFEQDAATGWGNSTYVMDGVGVNGSRGLKFETTVNEGDSHNVNTAAYYKGEFNSILEPYTTYIFSFDYKHEGMGFPELDVVQIGTDWTGWADTGLSSNVDWTHKTIEFTTGAEENMNANTRYDWRFRHVHYASAGNYGTGTAYFDNVKLIKKPEATSIALDQTTATVEAGSTVTLTASALPEGADLPEIEWTSSDGTVATVADGEVTGVNAGTTTITATAAGMTPVTCTVTVVPKNLITNGNFEDDASVGWGNSAYVLNEVGVNGSRGMKIETTVNEGGSHAILGAYYKGAFNGILEPNTTYIFSFDYKHEGMGFPQLDVVQVGTDWTGWTDTDLSSNVDWTHKTIEFTTGAEENMNANARYEWQFRHVHYAAAGNYGTGAAYFDNVKLIKKPEATSIALDQTTATVEAGSTVTLTASALPEGADLPEITWTSSDGTVATVAGGVVTGLKAGTTTITAAAEGMESVTCTVTVEAKNLFVNGDMEQGASVSWNSSTYIQNGVGNGGGYGYYYERPETGAVTAQVRYGAALLGNMTANTEYLLTFDYKTSGTAQGQLYFDQSFGTTSDGKTLNGGYDLPTGVTEWTTQAITFTTPASITTNPRYEFSIRTSSGVGGVWFDNFKLIVAPEVVLEGITLDKTTATIETDSTVTLTATANPEGADISELTWESSDATVATVAGGVVTGLKAGTATITAKVGDITATCTVTVEAKNFFVNGDMEQGGSTNWNDTTSSYIKNGVGNGGGYGYYYNRTQTDEWTSEAQVRYKGALLGDMAANTEYLLTFDYKTSGTALGRLVFDKPFGTTSDGKALSSDYDLPTGVTEWTTQAITFTTPATLDISKGWEFSIRVRGGAGEVWFDNFKLIEKPEVVLEGITLDKTTATIETDSTVTLTATANPEGADISELAWESSDTTVATVAGGVVTGLKAGTATITAKVGDITATCTVTVEAKNFFVNGDMEQGSATNWGSSAYIQNGVGNGGGYGYYYERPETDAVTAQARYKAALLGNMAASTEYLLTFDYKTSGTAQGQLYFDQSFGTTSDGKALNGGYDLPTGVTEWTTQAITFTTPASITTNKGYEFSIRTISGVGGVWFDNLKLIEKPEVVLEGITLDKTTATVEAGSTVTLTATANPEGADISELTWESSDATVATVAGGVVTCLKAGTATITAKVGDITATFTVTVEAKNFFVNGDMESGSATNWGSSEYIQSGVGNGGGYGYYYKRTQTDEWTAEATVRYRGALLGNMTASTEYVLTFDYKTSGAALGQLSFIRSFGTTSDGKTLSGEYDLPTGVTEWTTQVIRFTTPATLDISKGWEFSIRVRGGAGEVWFDNFRLVKASEVVLEGITLNQATATVNVDKTVTLTASAVPVGADISALTWESSDATVATVVDGVVTGLKAGTATITAKVGDFTATCTVTVEKLMATELTLNKQAVTLSQGATETLTTSVSPEGGWYDTLVWTTSDATVATVDGGVITAVGVGTAVIGVTAGSLSATCAVTVEAVPLLTNGDFEQGAVAPWTAANATIQDGVGFGDTKGLVVPADAVTIYWRPFAPTLKPNSVYQITFLAKGPEICLCNGGNTTDMTIETAYAPEVAGEWTTVRCIITTGANPSMHQNYGLCFKRETAATAPTYIDNVEMTLLPDDADQILGGSFDAIGGKHWVNHLPAGATVKTEDDGNKALYIPEYAEDPGDMYMRDLYRLSLNTKYVLSFKAKGAPIDLYLNPDYLTGTTGWKTTAQSDDYVTYAYEFTTMASINANYLINITRETTYGGETGTYIDDVSLRPASSDLIAEELVIIGGDNVEAGTELIFGVKITNNGTGTVNTAFPVEFRLNGTFWTHEVTYKGEIAPGATVTVLSNQVWTAVTGNYSVSAKINGTMAVAEPDLTNNTVARELRVGSTLETPEVALNAGFDTLTFVDEFDSIDTIDMAGTGEAGYKWYVNRPYGASQVTVNDLAVSEDGILTLKLSDPAYNYGIATMDAKTGNGFSFNKGYMEIRFRIPKSEANDDDEVGIPAIWSFPPEKITGKANAWVEMDWMEYWGKNWSHWNGYYTVTMHDQSLNEDGTSKHHYTNQSSAIYDGLGDEEWHTMGWLWEEGKITTYLDGEIVMTQAYSADSTGTPTATANQGTLENGVFTGMDTLQQVLILGGSADNNLEVDYVQIWQDVDADADEAPYVYADTTVEGGDIQFGEAGEMLTDVAQGAYVTVTAKPDDGFIMVPGSLKYVLADGTEVKILNQSFTDQTFGGGDGTTFEFEMPAESVKITAKFVDASSTSFAADTIGTSLYHAQDGSYTGIRFLNRMNMSTKFDPQFETLTVTYEGEEYEVIEIGSLLKRATNETALTVANVEANLNTSGANRMWKSVAYQKGGTMKLVDYTDSYIDFTVVMKAGQGATPEQDARLKEQFARRQYTACGYIKLQKADGTGTVETIEFESQITNSVETATALL